MKFGRKDYDERIIDKGGLIPDDEPVFFLRGKDKLAPKLLMKWVTEFLLSGGDQLVAESAMKHAHRMVEYQRINGSKLADVSSNDSFTNDRLEAINGIINRLDNMSDKNQNTFTPQVDYDPNYMTYINRLLTLIPNSEENIMLLTEISLKESAYDKKIQDLDVYDFNLDDDVVTKSYSTRYIIYLNKVMNIVHFIKK